MTGAPLIHLWTSDKLKLWTDNVKRLEIQVRRKKGGKEELRHACNEFEAETRRLRNQRKRVRRAGR